MFLGIAKTKETILLHLKEHFFNIDCVVDLPSCYTRSLECKECSVGYFSIFFYDKCDVLVRDENG